MTQSQINAISYEQALNVLKNNGYSPFLLKPDEVIKKAKEILNSTKKKK